MEPYDLEVKLKTYLNRHAIRLCDSPYTNENEQGDGLKILAETLSTELKHDSSEIEKVLNLLRLKAINNTRSSKKFKEGICSIKIRQPKSIEDISLEIPDISQATGLHLKHEISKLLFLSDENLKVIFKGKLINDNDLLQNQGLYNNSKVMVLHIAKSDLESQEECLNFGKYKDMAEYLAQRAIDGQFKSEFMNVEITNQSGEVLSLTNDQKSFLTFGLAMHQQAITSICNNQYQIALIYCLEADEAFARSQYCDSIDNTAILQLDIVWCYYCLQNMDDLPDARKRLDICEERMRKCYGEDNERIKRIRERKSFEGIPESVHVYRLYLLKAIIAYYENNIGNGREYLFKALEVYNAFVITEPLITQVMLLGFTRQQAIDGLRVSKDPNSCVEYILRREEDKRVLEENSQASSNRAEIARRLGNTMGDHRIDVEVLERLIEQSHMNPSLCLAAVRRANNNFTDAMELLFSEEERLLEDIELQRQKGLVVDGDDISYESLLREKAAVRQIRQLVTNIDKSTICHYLRQVGGNVEAALAVLTDENQNIITDSPESRETDNSFSSERESEIERQLHETIGEGASKSLESQYTNPDLTNEILAFNKFAKLLDVPEIVHEHDDVVW